MSIMCGLGAIASSQPLAPAKGDAAYQAACLADSASLFVRLSTGTPVDASTSAAALSAYSGTATFTTDATYGQVLNGPSIAWKVPTVLLNLSAYTLEGVAQFATSTGYLGLVGRFNGGGNMLSTAPSNSIIAVNGTSATGSVIGGMGGAWHHIAQTFDGTTLTVYINGTSVASRTSPVTGSIGGGNFIEIGTYQNDVSMPRWVGQIHSVSVYPTALSAIRIAAHAAAII